MGRQTVDHYQIPHPSQPLHGRGRHVRRPPPAPSLGCLRAPLLTPRAPRSGTCSRGRRRDYYTVNVCWISCCEGVHPKVPPMETIHLRIIVCTFFTNTAICEGDECGSQITIEAISSTSYNIEV
ncbi:hypothetical protein M9H77_13730 [Catharanthus roseus]|uniref:Uncharacterized protein n=1 Tax=Catharanthus roseus TaxID=4058 RepID=A0ACC0BL21_CATRO|nr:hypothetical protein M9H77_13730 [Catharanthus roseus]